MQSKLLGADKDGRIFALVFGQGEDAVAGLQQFAELEKLGGSHFTAIGAFQRVTLGYFERDRKKYRRIPLDEQVEVVSLIGNVALAGDDRPRIHAHVVVGRSDGHACGGHLLEGIVWPTLEVVLSESPLHLRRRLDPETGLALLEL
ncbi:MAG TPA: PPC domain-containing DNA-binding protein [Gemmatimonadales bacterium]|nr:PPC domain-containing DNA-binding protein [Gemmatimonadales bacterium]